MNSMLSKLNGNSFILVLLPILFIPLIFYKTTLSMMHVWSVNETFTHGFFVLPLVVWLLWQKRSQLLLIHPRPELQAFILLTVLLSVWLVSAVADIKIIQQFCMVTAILTAIWLIAGRQVLFFVFFPLLFLYFAVPFGQVFIPPLMAFTADFTVAMIKMVGVPVYRDGFSFTLPSGSWSVVEECSGVRYLIASFSLGSIYAYLNYSSTKKRVIFILLSLVVPILGNGLRAFGIVMIGHYSDMRLAVGVDHLLYGWVFFGAVIFLLFYLGSFWRDSEDSFDVVNDDKSAAMDNRNNYSPFVLLVIIFALMASFSAFSNHIENNKQVGKTPVAFRLPDNFSGWQYDAEQSFSWQPVSINADADISRGYFLDDNFVQLNIAYYKMQRQDAEAISTSNKITNPYGGDWKLISSTSIFEGNKGFMESELKYSDKKLLVWSWYRVGKYETPNPYIAKALEVYNLIAKGRSDASIVSVATRFDDTKAITRQKIYDFWQKSASDISNKFEQLRNE